ncbi:MAG: accessory gene regulator ArgB-like protein [Dethiobacteria bacterium]|jgi:accessory gene regulator B
MHRMANFLGNYIASKLSYDDDRREIITYGTFVLMHNLSILIIILLLALITGLLKEIAIVMLAYAPLRRFGGGLHLSKPVFCMVSSVIIFPLLGFSAVVMLDYLLYLAPFGRYAIFLLIAGITLLAVMLYAPREHPNHPLSAGRRVFLKRLTFIVALILTVLLISIVSCGASYLREAAAISMAFIFLSLNLLPAGIVCLEKLDRFFSHFFQKEAKGL